MPGESLDLSRDGARLWPGPAGSIEVLVDGAATVRRGIAIIAHPQPLLGGSARHKVPHFLARTVVEDGWLAIRPNFRGVGASGGVHDAGNGETDDLAALCEAARAGAIGRPLALIGVSFGAYVCARVARRLADAGAPASRTCLAAMPFGDVPAGRRYDTPDGMPAALVLHGELDEQVPLASIFDWARPTSQPVTVIAGADHLFTGKLPVVRAQLRAHLDLK